MNYFSSFLLLSLSLPSRSFIFPLVKPQSSLSKYTDAQAGMTFDIQLVVSQEKDESHMALDGLRICLDTQEPKYDHPLMPGANGPHPNLSGGIRALQMTKAPTFISSGGLQNVELLNGCWEMIWRENVPAGSIICGFDVPNEVYRNDHSSLPAGRMYITLPVFTRESLEECREQKRSAEEKASKFLKERDEAMAQVSETDNLLMKALHYRNAYAALEKYFMSGHNKFKDVPIEDVEPIGDGLFVCKKGTVWTKEGSFRKRDHVLLGYALLKAGAAEKPNLAP